MNKSKIEYLTHAWNFYTGCNHWKTGVCAVGENCWAKGLADRFHRPFEPTLHPELLLDPLRLKKPGRIGVCFTGDLFGDWVDPEMEVRFGDIDIIIKGDHIFMGVQATDCDPKMTTLKGDLTAALARVPSFVEESNKQWDVAAKNPEAPKPVTPPPAPRTATTSSSASKPVAAAPAKQPAQPKFF